MISTPHRWTPLARAAALCAATACLPLTGLAQPVPTTETTPATNSIEVVGRRQGGAYEAGDVSGTKTTLPQRELPQSTRVMSRQAMDDLGAVRLDDVLDHVGGISRQNNFGGLWDNIAIRGLPGNENTGMPMLLNGFAANRGFNAPRDTVDLERVEFLKGPAGALYGASEPGGTINLVTKRPRWQRATSMEVYAGSFDFARTAIDTTGPVGDTMAYRLNAALESRGSFRDHVRSRRAVLAPALSFKLGANTTLDYTGQWIQHSTPLDRGVQAIQGVLGSVPPSQFPGEPADGRVKVDNRTHQLVLQHELSPQWQLRGAIGLRNGTLQGASTEPASLRPDNHTLWRQRRDRDYRSDDISAQAELQGRLDLAGMAHEVLIGLDAYRFHLDQRMLRFSPNATTPYALDLLAPVYGQTQPTPLPNTDTRETQHGTALTLQDAVVLAPQWRLVAGVRLDQVRQSLDNRRTGARTSQHPTEALPRLGISYLPTAQWTLYVNTGKSLRANAGSDAAGTAFKPESGQALEAGAKWESADQRFGGTLALFNISKRNVLTADAANPGYSVTAGEVTSRGAELDVAGQLTRSWRVTGSLSYADVDAGGGARLLNVPHINGSLLAVFEDALPDASRIGLGGGITHMGRRLGETATNFDLPAYTTVKLVAYWRATPTLRVSVDVDNLFDSTHYTSSYSRIWVTPGAPRSVVVGVQAKF